MKVTNYKNVETLRESYTLVKENIDEKQDGITLISLVITIIVLLILAGVSIAMLTGQNGILSKAGEAKTETRGAAVQEACDLWKASKKADSYTTTETAQKLDDVLNDLVKQGNLTTDEKDIIIGNSWKGIIATKQITIGTRTINFEIELAISNIDINETKPEDAKPSDARIIEGDGNKGITIIDKNYNEWVWIEVPKTITKNAETDKSIETALQEYVTEYKEDGYTDTWYNIDGESDVEKAGGMGLTKIEYDTLKSKMLQSIKTNGGFYIGKYEVGDETTTSAGLNGRTDESSNQKPVIQKNKYPYNYVTCKQAQELSNQLTSEGRTCSLMFGVQWDLVMKYLEVKGKKLESDLKTNSISWGNYKEGRFNLIVGSYSSDNGKNWMIEPYNKVKDEVILVTTGSIYKNSCMNIYDIAGNVWEWTLENSNTKESCVGRGGSYKLSGSSYPVSYRGNDLSINSSFSDGFRATFY